MSTAPNAVPQGPYPHIKVGVQLFEERILPAKMAQTNGPFFNGWFASKRMNILNMTPGQIADAMYEATLADCAKPAKDRQLKWVVEPAILAKEKTKGPAHRADAREADVFEQKVRAGEKADEQRRIQEQAKKRVIELVSGFTPTNHRRGTLNYDLRDKQQAAWRKRVAEAKDFVALEKEIATEQRKLYEAAEKAAERV